jgi:hypothetical protein
MQAKDAAAEAEAFSALVAELEADQGSPAPEEAAPEADSVEGDPEADEESEELNEEESTEAAPDVDGFKAELAAAVEAGDLKAVAERLGLDPSVFKLNNKQFAAVRKGSAEAKRLKAEAEASAAKAAGQLTQAQQLQAKAEEVYGPIVAGAQAYKQGDATRVRAALELQFGDTLENIIAMTSRAAKGLDPAQAEVLRLRQELAAEKAAKTAEATKQAEAEATAKEVSSIEGRLKGTPLEGVEGAAADIYKAVKASYNPALGRYTKTLREAYAEVKGVYAKKAAQLARLSGAKPAAPAAPGRQPLAPKPASSPRKTAKLTEEEEFAATLREAARASQAEQRRMRRRS